MKKGVYDTIPRLRAEKLGKRYRCPYCHTQIKSAVKTKKIRRYPNYYVCNICGGRITGFTQT